MSTRPNRRATRKGGSHSSSKARAAMPTSTFNSGSPAAFGDASDNWTSTDVEDLNDKAIGKMGLVFLKTSIALPLSTLLSHSNNNLSVEDIDVLMGAPVFGGTDVHRMVTAEVTAQLQAASLGAPLITPTTSGVSIISGTQMHADALVRAAAAHNARVLHTAADLAARLPAEAVLSGELRAVLTAVGDDLTALPDGLVVPVAPGQGAPAPAPGPTRDASPSPEMPGTPVPEVAVDATNAPLRPESSEGSVGSGTGSGSGTGAATPTVDAAAFAAGTDGPSDAATLNMLLFAVAAAETDEALATGETSAAAAPAAPATCSAAIEVKLPSLFVEGFYWDNPVEALLAVRRLTLSLEEHGTRLTTDFNKWAVMLKNPAWWTKGNVAQAYMATHNDSKLYFDKLALAYVEGCVRVSNAVFVLINYTAQLSYCPQAVDFMRRHMVPVLGAAASSLEALLSQEHAWLRTHLRGKGITEEMKEWRTVWKTARQWRTSVRDATRTGGGMAPAGYLWERVLVVPHMGVFLPMDLEKRRAAVIAALHIDGSLAAAGLAAEFDAVHAEMTKGMDDGAKAYVNILAGWGKRLEEKQLQEEEELAVAARRAAAAAEQRAAFADAEEQEGRTWSTEEDKEYVENYKKAIVPYSEASGAAHAAATAAATEHRLVLSPVAQRMALNVSAQRAVLCATQTPALVAQHMHVQQHWTAAISALTLSAERLAPFVPAQRLLLTASQPTKLEDHRACTAAAAATVTAVTGAASPARVAAAPNQKTATATKPKTFIAGKIASRSRCLSAMSGVRGSQEVIILAPEKATAGAKAFTLKSYIAAKVSTAPRAAVRNRCFTAAQGGHGEDEIVMAAPEKKKKTAGLKTFIKRTMSTASRVTTRSSCLRVMPGVLGGDEAVLLLKETKQAEQAVKKGKGRVGALRAVGKAARWVGKGLAAALVSEGPALAAEARLAFPLPL